MPRHMIAELKGKCYKTLPNTSTVTIPFYILTSNKCKCLLLCSLATNLLLSILWILVILIGILWYLIMIFSLFFFFETKSQVEDCLLCKCEALSSNPSPTKK
jgi:hypothetical protein